MTEPTERDLYQWAIDQIVERTLEASAQGELVEIVARMTLERMRNGNRD